MALLQQVNAGRTQFLDANGSPLAGGSVTTYAPGTTTPLTTYQDPTGNTMNANPVPLDGLGSAAIWSNSLVRMIVKDAAGNTVYDQLGGARPGGSGAVGIDPQAYGAAGNGTTNDRAALALADTAAVALSAAIFIAKPYFIGSDITLASPLLFVPGGQLLWSNGTDVVISNTIDAGPFQIFGGWPSDTSTPRLYTADDASRLTISKGQVVWAEWFGALANGTFNDKPAIQRLAFAAPGSSFNWKRVPGKTYLYDNGGLCFRTDRPATAVFTDKSFVEIDMAGATDRLADGTQYCCLNFTTSNTDPQNPTLDEIFVHDGVLDGNKSGNLAQWAIDKAKPGGSASNKGYGTVFRCQGYRRAVARNMRIINTIHYGIDLRECEQVHFETCQASGGYPMQFDVDADQAAYLSARGNYTGLCQFVNSRCSEGSQHITFHSVLDGTEPIEASRTTAIIQGYDGLNWAEAGIHIENVEVARVSDFSMEINDASLSSGNVADLTVGINSRRTAQFIDCKISNGSLINGRLKVYDEMGAGNKPGRTLISGVHVLKTMGGLIGEPEIEAQNSSTAENCTVRGTATYPIASTGILAQEAINCIVEYTQGLEVYTRAEGCTINNTTGTAVTVDGSTFAYVDCNVDTATIGIRHKFGDCKVTGKYSNIQGMVIQNDSTTGDLFVKDAYFKDWGLDTGLTSDRRACISGADGSGDGAFSPTIQVDGCHFEITNANAYGWPIRANHANQGVYLRNCSYKCATGTMYTPSMIGDQGSRWEPFDGANEAVTSTANVLIGGVLGGQAIGWTLAKDIDLTLASPQTVTHLSTGIDQLPPMKDAVIRVNIRNSNAGFDFTKANGDDTRFRAIKHQTKTTWSPTNGAYMELHWTGKYWLAITQDA